MQCPICKLDLSALDYFSKQEHCEICIENGPSVVTTNEAGQLIIQRNVASDKQRKICPICDKTFQNLVPHFKTCSIKNDVPPQLMLEYWDKINSECRRPKKFPRQLLDSFVKKCVREGRIGEQVDFARALSLSMAEAEPQTSLDSEDTTQPGDDNSVQSVAATETTVDQVLMSSATTARRTNAAPGKPADKKKQQHRLELVSDAVKRSNIFLRIDRELSASRSKRHEEVLKAAGLSSCSQQSGIDCDDDIVILEDPEISDIEDPNKLFFRARLKDCTDSSDCQQGICQGHDLMLLMEEFEAYAGTSMDADPARKRDNELENEAGTSQAGKVDSGDAEADRDAENTQDAGGDEEQLACVNPA